jgi:hypothetical protein
MYTTSERRIKPRVSCDYPATMMGYDNQGRKIIENATLENLSGSGLYMWINKYIEYGAKLTVTVRLINASLTDEETPHLAIKGIVVRTEPQNNGTCGIAVKFNQYRFL